MTADRLSSAAKLRLAAEVLVTYLRARRTVRRLPLPEALARLRDRVFERAQTRGPGAGAGTPERLARATQRTLRTLPTDTRCLMQSVTLSALLARRGTPSRLIIGVRPGEEFGAHAWVELEGRPLLPPGGDTFQRLVEL
jgi:Transglutaminase-like superfamily